jgi:hypothetical protein
VGLTIHYQLECSPSSTNQARSLVERLQQRARDLPFQEVGDVIELRGDEADFQKVDRDHPHRWLLIQAASHLEVGDIHYTVAPQHVIAFATHPAEGAEAANFGLAVYPKTLLLSGKRVRTNLTCWSWGSFCKTQYASNPAYGGVENFLRAHLLVVSLLDHAAALGLVKHVSDEGDYWENRDLESLAKQVGQWNEMIAAIAGQFKDTFGAGAVSEIGQFPNFEHLEAKGRTKHER